jgi:hypothetical protein
MNLQREKQSPIGWQYQPTSRKQFGDVLLFNKGIANSS